MDAKPAIREAFTGASRHRQDSSTKLLKKYIHQRVRGACLALQPCESCWKYGSKAPVLVESCRPLCAAGSALLIRT